MNGWTAAIAAGFFIAAPAAAQDRQCASLPLTPAQRARQAADVSAGTHTRIAPAAIDYLWAQGDWKLIWLRPGGDARRIHLFHRVGGAWRFVATWRGTLGTDDPQAGIDWATSHGMPAALTDCLANVMINRP